VVKFVPNSVLVPTGIKNKEFKIRMLTIHDLVLDYDAVMTSIEHLKGVFGPNSSWPSKNLTLEQDLVDLAWHQKEFEIKSSFAYTVLNLNETQCLGCLYINPTEKVGYDAEIIFWVRKSEIANGLDERLFSEIKFWLSKEWWFKNVGFPGRLIDWEQWNALPSKLNYETF
tara:strand:- start:902 stop:1411 length:510 start_codon:yes stop_codon:yes gene_type:complete